MLATRPILPVSADRSRLAPVSDGTSPWTGYLLEMNIYTNLSYPDCIRELTYLRSKYTLP